MKICSASIGPLEATSDLLLSEGEADEVLQRAEQVVKWSKANLAGLLTIALGHLSLGRAQFHRTQADPDLAQRDLDEVRILIRRTGMRLFEADLELEQARCYLANNGPDSARNTLAKAKALVESMNCGRRRPEVEAL